ncbi:MAG: hypothetical protein QOF16_1826 [Actinomycetota bacterium]|nr:hypothetical protein [Actinomycetota bacterium]
MQTASEIHDMRFPALIVGAAFAVAAAFGVGVVTMAAFDSRPIVQQAPGGQGQALAAAPAPGGTVINGTVDDFSIHLDRVSAPAGEMTFHIQNLGPSFHEFVIERSSHAAGKMPIVKEEGYMRAAEDGHGDAHVDEIGGIKVGATGDLTTNLKAGHYIIICNLPHHYMQGMRISFTVK